MSYKVSKFIEWVVLTMSRRLADAHQWTQMKATLLCLLLSSYIPLDGRLAVGNL